MRCLFDKRERGEKMEKGDYVQVKNWGDEYTTYTNWFIENKIDPIYMIRYGYGDNTYYKKYAPESDNRIFEIVYLDELSGIALITLSEELNDSYTKMKDLDRLRQIHLINIRGLKKVRVMTKEELENELGCAVLLVNKKVEEKTNES